MLEQEMQLKKLANYKKSDFAKAEIEREKQLRKQQEAEYAIKLQNEKKQAFENKMKWRSDLEQ